jgi:hypothetical protein
LIRLSNGKENKVEQYGLLEKRRKTGEGKEEQESERTHQCGGSGMFIPDPGF